MPIVQQPQQYDSNRRRLQEDNQWQPIIWKTISAWHVVPPTCPQGLEYLSLIDKVFIVEKSARQQCKLDFIYFLYLYENVPVLL